MSDSLAKPFEVATGIGPVTDGIINTFLNKITSGGVVDRVTAVVSSQVRKYIYFAGLLYLVLVALLIFIIYILLRKK